MMIAHPRDGGFTLPANALPVLNLPPFDLVSSVLQFHHRLWTP
jgi:hypothetical protein